MIELLASDLDGTLVRSDGSISQRSVEAIRAAEQAGVTVVFVTGRPPRWLGDVARATGGSGLAICTNGALVYDLHTEQVVESFPISVEVARQAAEDLRAAFPGVRFAVETATSFGREADYVSDADMPDVRVAAIAELVDSPVAKLLVRSSDHDSDELLEAAREVLGDTVTATHSTRGPHALLEISAAGVTKASTLARFCEERGLGPEQVVAVGDMPNDLPMLAWAGTAYAVANAHPDVLAAVELVTASNDDDGVAVLLEGVVAERHAAERTGT
ncbi:hypothetical protein CLV35_0703 [Motilibacter peucedani]|uniref:Cof subfamily protein (Haloacid dehalogenase superfamily)/HAD superfamily hydrolase (TIGR01484 family) n=1 Tax=Motilibacter peucedani TaxID=598650 RepID=A0A420XU39_9ACTN|nr:Cof-type HAD-IIB family hydrolase [Motilibacter peucedani]RKS80277.1 hypothetical protein CLV35_0703 [Motilibacter peucedani]